MIREVRSASGLIFKTAFMQNHVQSLLDVLGVPQCLPRQCIARLLVLLISLLLIFAQIEKQKGDYQRESRGEEERDDLEADA